MHESRTMQIFAPLTSEQIPGIQRIEIASSFQLPSFQIIGLPAPEVAEAKERIRAALESSGFELPKRRIVVNLSPASIRKRGTGLDLSMALAVLLQKNEEFGLDDCLVAAWGELGLDGSVKSAGQHAQLSFSVASAPGLSFYPGRGRPSLDDFTAMDRRRSLLSSSVTTIDSCSNAETSVAKAESTPRR